MQGGGEEGRKGSLVLKQVQFLSSKEPQLLYSFRDFRGAKEVKAAVWEVGKGTKGKKRRGGNSYIIVFLNIGA